MWPARTCFILGPRGHSPRRGGRGVRGGARPRREVHPRAIGVGVPPAALCDEGLSGRQVQPLVDGPTADRAQPRRALDELRVRGALQRPEAVLEEAEAAPPPAPSPAPPGAAPLLGEYESSDEELKSTNKLFKDSKFKFKIVSTFSIFVFQSFYFFIYSGRPDPRREVRLLLRRVRRPLVSHRGHVTPS